MGDELIQDSNKSSHMDTDCCGGSAPAGTDACCRRDAEARAAGRNGCGCAARGPGAQISPTKNSCCWRFAA